MMDTMAAKTRDLAAKRNARDLTQSKCKKPPTCGRCYTGGKPSSLVEKRRRRARRCEGRHIKKTGGLPRVNQTRMRGKKMNKKGRKGSHRPTYFSETVGEKK